MSQIILTDEEILTQLNSDYVNSFIHGNAQRYEEILAENYVSITPSGKLISRAEFIAGSTAPAEIIYFHVEDVKIWIHGDVAQIYARTPYKWQNGREGVNCYIDTWLKRDGGWQCISGHVTRVE